ncbi:MAG TPA: hypothetical protein P5208_10005 [Smithellaceae bacterium]|nr:hypothetical protein [Smithellaceae bacterium]HRV45625.1 hypothetical protein [Smithellaceae bacterium]
MLQVQQPLVQVRQAQPVLQAPRPVVLRWRVLASVQLQLLALLRRPLWV